MGKLLHLKSMPDKKRGRKEHLGVANILVRHVPGREFGNVREIFVFAQELILPGPQLNELSKVLVFETPCEFCHVLNRWIAAILLDQIVQRVEGEGALKMDVQFDLRYFAVPSHFILVFSEPNNDYTAFYILSAIPLQYLQVVVNPSEAGDLKPKELQG
jgi:hypothetical protein